MVNIISDWFIEAANHTCGMFDYGVNELQLSGLTPIPSEQARAFAIVMMCGDLAHVHGMTCVWWGRLNTPHRCRHPG